MAYRIDKVEHLIKQEISLIFLHKLSHVDLGCITIMNVRVNNDMKKAKIY